MVRPLRGAHVLFIICCFCIALRRVSNGCPPVAVARSPPIGCPTPPWTWQRRPQPHSQVSRLRRGAAGSRQDQTRNPFACRTDTGQELEDLLLRAKVADRALADESVESLLQGDAVGLLKDPVVGLKAWLQELSLTHHYAAVSQWVESMGACDLDELVQNVDSLSADVALSEDEALRLRLKAEEASVQVAAKARLDVEPGMQGLALAKLVERSREASALELDALIEKHHDAGSRGSQFESFDRRFDVAVDSVRHDVGDAPETLESQLAKEVRERLIADLKYLAVLRAYTRSDIDGLPTFECEGKPWTCSGEGVEHWSTLADKLSFRVPLGFLTAAQCTQLRNAILEGKQECDVLLEAYVANELRMWRGEIDDDNSPCSSFLSTFKRVVQNVQFALASAAELPDKVRDGASAPVAPNGDQTGVAMLGTIMDNTRVAQSDVYFGHVLFGICLGRVARRFHLSRTLGLLTPLSEADRQRASLEQRAATGSPKLRSSRALGQDLLSFVRSLFDGENDSGGATLLEQVLALQPTMLAAVRQHIARLFGQDLRAEILRALEEVSNANARAGKAATEPHVCAAFLLDTAKAGRLRMLSLGYTSKERLLWDALLFGVLLERCEESLALTTE